MYLRKLVSLDVARAVGTAALAKAIENPDRPVAIAIVDATSELVYFAKMDNCLPPYAKLAINKAYTVVHMEMDTAELSQFLKMEPGLAISNFVDPRLTPIPGGAAMRAPDGAIIGAIGVSGRRPEADKVSDVDIAQAGVKASL
jgi:uncharacterized protein GlcG (DUF336 family)